MHIRKSLAHTVMVSLLLTGVVGCVGGENGQKAITDQAKVAKIQKGVSTKADIQAMFGQPAGRNFAANGDEVWTYSFSATHVDPKTYIPIVGSIAGGATVTASSLVVTFGQNGIVSSYGTNNSGAASGFGQM